MADFKTRSQAPIIKMKDGQIVFYCPFCFPRHPLVPGEKSHCGASFELIVKQRIYEHVKCKICGKTGGTLMKTKDGFIHTPPCTSKAVFLPTDPVNSKFAQFLYHLPGWMSWFNRYVSKKRDQHIAQLTDNKTGKHIYTWFEN